MSSLRDFSIPEAYNQIRSMDTLVGLEPIVDWNALGSMVSSLFKNNTEKGGRPNFDEITMIRTLFIQELYGLSDEATERELYDRISFRHFLHYPDKMPDARTIWLFRERLSSSGMDKKLWEAIWKQFNDRGIRIEKGVIQDASYIESDHGKHGRRKPPVPVDPEPPQMTKNEETGESPGKGDAADPDQKKKMTKAQKKAAKIKASEKKRLSKEERRSSKTRRSKDGTFTKKDNRTHFGYKLHSSVGVDMPLIREFVVTTAALHDANVDLSVPDMPCYRDKGYQGAPCRGLNGTMDRASRNNPLSIDQVRRNLRISRKRSPGERPYSIIKGKFNGDHVYVTMVRRVRVKAMFKCFCYNLFTLMNLKKRGKIAAAM
ncbi:MAG: IS5 family transposase [Thermoplasmataceae archaeon]